MKSKIKLLTFAYLLFLLFNTLAGLTEGIWSDFSVIAAFLLPVIVVLLVSAKRGDPDTTGNLFKLNTDGADLLLSLGIPTVVAVAVLSYLTSLLIYSTFGVTDSVALSDSYFVSVMSLALVPALLEELLFRYLPMKLLLPHSARATVIISSAAFALAHGSLFQLAYALVAGAVFMVLDIAANSIVPSMILHFMNNIISVTALYYSDNTTVIILLNVIICLLFAASLAYFTIKRKHIVGKISFALSCGEKYHPDAVPLLYAAPALILAILDLLSKLQG